MDFIATGFTLAIRFASDTGSLTTPPRIRAIPKKPNCQRTFCRHLLAFAGRLGRRVFFFLHLIIPERSNESRNSIYDKDLARFWASGERFFSPRFLPCQIPAGETYSQKPCVHQKKKSDILPRIYFGLFFDVSRWRVRTYEKSGPGPHIGLFPYGNSYICFLNAIGLQLQLI